MGSQRIMGGFMFLTSAADGEPQLSLPGDHLIGMKKLSHKMSKEPDALRGARSAFSSCR